MEPCKSMHVRTGLFFLFLTLFSAAVPAFCQRGTLGIDLGEITDKYGALPSTTTGVVGVEGQFNIIQAGKGGGPNIDIGGELRAPADTSTHAPEFAVFGGPIFPIGQSFSIGVNAEVRKIYMSSVPVDGTFIDRFNMELLEVPIILKYKFASDHRAFIQVQGQPEFTPRFVSKKRDLEGVLHPNFDYGYTVRGSLGYNFGKWYAKATYETRIFKFLNNQNNVLGVYNWHNTTITGGVGLNF